MAVEVEMGKTPVENSLEVTLDNGDTRVFLWDGGFIGWLSRKSVDCHLDQMLTWEKSYAQSVHCYALRILLSAPRWSQSPTSFTPSDLVHGLWLPICSHIQVRGWAAHQDILLTSSTGFLILWAKASDHLGRKLMICMAIGIFIIFSGACRAAQSIAQL